MKASILILLLISSLTVFGQGASVEKKPIDPPATSLAGRLDLSPPPANDVPITINLSPWEQEQVKAFQEAMKKVNVEQESIMSHFGVFQNTLVQTKNGRALTAQDSVVFRPETFQFVIFKKKKQ